MLKKIVALILVCSTLLMPVCSVAASEVITIEPTLLSLVDNSVSEWYADTEVRALFIAVIMMEVVLGAPENNQAIMLSAYAGDTVYIARDTFNVSALFFGEDSALLVVYTPIKNSLEVCEVEVSSILSNLTMNELKENGAIDSYYKVKATDIGIMYEVVTDMLKSLQK